MVRNKVRLGNKSQTGEETKSEWGKIKPGWRINKARLRKNLKSHCRKGRLRENLSWGKKKKSDWERKTHKASDWCRQAKQCVFSPCGIL